MKPCATVALLVLNGCSGASLPDIPTPGHCGIARKVETFGGDAYWEERPDECLWVETDCELSDAEDCPNGVTCRILLPGDEVTAWGSVSGRECTVVARGFFLALNGTCPVSCEKEFGCTPDPEEPSICEPCTAEKPCE